MKQKKISTPEELKFLEIKLDVLIDEYQKQDTLVREKANLLEKTTLARTQVEAMISRLKEMEQNT